MRLVDYKNIPQLLTTSLTQPAIVNAFQVLPYKVYSFFSFFTDVLCCLFLFDCFGLDHAQSTLVVYLWLWNKPFKMIGLRSSCLVYDAKQKIIRCTVVVPVIFISSFEIAGHFPLLTMDKGGHSCETDKDVTF